MSVESVVFILRLFVGLSLIGFLLALFVIVWRSMRLLDNHLAAARATYGYLTMRSKDQRQIANRGDRYPLRAITTLGRSANNMIVVHDDFASGEHARIVLEDGQWWLEDRDSRNGTLLNNAAIDRRAILADGDVIGIGNFSFRLSLESEPVN